MKKAEHLTEEQFNRYRHRTLSPAELLDVDRHVAQCETCLARFWRESDAGPALRGLRDQFSEHLDYDQIVACATGSAAEPWERHLSECEPCRSEVADLRQFCIGVSATSQPAAVIPMPVPNKSWRAPAITAIAAGTVLAVGLSFWNAKNRPAAPPPALVSQQDQPAEPPLSAEQQAAVQLALASGEFERAPVLGRLIAKRGVLLGMPDEARTFTIGGPLGTTVLSGRPSFHWQAVEGATRYVVSVFDAKFRKVTESPALAAPVWQPARPLAPGRIYNWQVTAWIGEETLRSPVPPAPEARFQVVTASDAAQIETARRDHPGNHLLLAVLLANAGALDEAAGELDVLAHTDAATARALQESLNKIRQQ